MALDRDLGVAFVRAARDLGFRLERGWEATAATGVRGLRLLHEAGSFRSFLLTDASPRTFPVLRRNAAEVPGATAQPADARRAPGAETFDYVDLDPYGSPLPFLDAGIRATRPGGVLAVTATDMTVLAGAQPAAARRLYGAEPVRGRLGPEGALRILLMVLAREARARGRSISPLLAYVGGHHVRAYVAVAAPPAGEDPVAVLEPASWTGPALRGAARVGPLWLGPLVEPALAGRLRVPPTAAQAPALARFLARLREDAGPVAPFYYEGNLLATELGLGSPPSVAALLAALREAGWDAGRTHVRPEGIRTHAPRPEVERAARRAVAAQSQNARVRA